MPISEQLRKAIEAAEKRGTTRYRIAKDAGIGYDGLARYLDYDRDIRLSSVDLLADSLGLELQPRAKTKRRRRS